MSIETTGTPTTSPAKKKEKIPPATIRLSFPKKGKIQPEGWAGVGIADDVQITLKGKIISLSDNSRDEWEGAGKEISIELSACRIFVDRENPMSIDEALEEEKRSRKRV